MRSLDSSKLTDTHPGVLLGAGPDGEAEGNLVDKVSKVVDQVQNAVVHCATQVPEEIAERVDGPADGDNETHGAESRLHVLADLVSCGSHVAGFTSEDLEQDEAPSGQASNEARPG